MHMTEKEKMQYHMLYDANYDEELLAERKVPRNYAMTSTICAHLMKKANRGC